MIVEGKSRNKTSAQIKARMKREQKKHDLGLASQTIRDATNKNDVLKTIATDDDDVEHVLETQEEMIPAMASSNL